MAVSVIRESEFRETMDSVVSPALQKRREDGAFAGYDGHELNYHVFRADSPTAYMVVVHGFTESSEKYEELSWYFVQSGYTVYLYDQRGHGASYRPVGDKTLTHVRRFAEYVLDLGCFLDRIVPKDLPRYLFSHSMGGAVSALYMEAHPHTFEKAVLSSPMIAPSTGKYPAAVGRTICRTMVVIGRSKKRIFLSSEYPGEEKFEDSCGNSQERFARYEQFRRSHPDFQNFSPTYRWTLESLKITRKILRRGGPERIRTKVMVLSAGQDNMVLIPPQKKFAARVPRCDYKLYEKAKHEIFISTDEIMDRFVPDILSFYES